MPTQERGFFTCDFCRLVCDTLDEATEHEYHCPKRPPGARPPAGGPPPSQYPPRHHLQGAASPYAPGGMPPLSEAEAYGGPPPHPQSASAAMHAPFPPPYKLRAIALIGPNDRSTGISPEDTLACQSIELFEATPGHASEFDASRSGGTPVVPRQVGIRCVHCAKAQMPPSSYCIIFPASLGTVASSARLMADNHLSSCQVAPPEIRNSCDAAAKRRQPQGNMEGRNAEEEERSHMALLDYCVGFCQHMGIVNKQPHKTGIAFADTEIPPMHPYGPPQTSAETPGSHRGGYSADRMGPPMYDPRMSRGMMPMMGGAAHNPTEPIAPTPLQRRRDRPGMESGEPTPGMYSVDRSEASHTPGGYGMPTPYRQQDPHGGEGGYASEVQTPVQPNFEGKEPSYPTPHSAQRPPPGGPPGGTPNESSPGFNPYDLPANFPFYQETDRSWHCKFCSHVHPSYRDPQSIWSAASGAPPPGDFIDGHLSMCRSYHQSMPSPPMYQGGPQPPYGAPHPYMPPGYPPPPGWDGPVPPGPGMHPQHMGYPPMGQPMMGDMPYPPPYPPSHMDPMGRPYPGGGPEDPMYGDRRPRHPPQGMPPHSNAPASQPSGPPPAGGPPRREDMGDSIRHSIAHLVAKENDLNTKEDEIGNAEKLVLDEDKLLLTDYFFYLMKQLRLCRFSEADRKTRGGKREKIQLGFGGLQCVHCSDVPNPRKFFWSNVDRLANSFAEIPGHVLKCRRCPQQTKDALTNLKQFHPEQMARLPRGSQKVFFRRMWRRLHDEDPEDGSALTDQTNTEKSSAVAGSNFKVETPQSDVSGAGGREMSPNENSPTAGDETPVLMERPTPEAARVLAETSQLSGPPSPTSRILLAIPEDKEWLSDMDCFIRKQLEVFCATETDVATAQSDRKFPVHVGQVGIRCVHCSLSSSKSTKVTPASGTAVSFPFSVSAIYESVREFQRLHLDSCENVPASVKTKLAAFKGSSSLSSVLRKYYVLAAKALGLQDTAEGMRSGGEPVPLGSQAAFSFSDVHTSDEAQRTSYAGEGAKVSPSKPPENAATGETSDDAGSEAPQSNPKRASSEGGEEPPMKKVKSEDEMEDAEEMAAENGEKTESAESGTQPASDDAENPTGQLGEV
eukprot:Nitzschia sp. Nitz4//scaffold203_size38902//20654//24028//NITZ4_007661-RA/size38902-processed-gene-0.62-mRNA-1//1//CDS//3329541427//6688//frame0